MFEWLVNSVFPPVGYFFGIIIGTAKMSLGSFFSMLLGAPTVFINVLTGETFGFHIGFTTDLSNFLIKNSIRSFINNLPFMDVPVWAALAILSVTVFIILRIIKSLIPAA